MIADRGHVDEGELACRLVSLRRRVDHLAVPEGGVSTLDGELQRARDLFASRTFPRLLHLLDDGGHRGEALLRGLFLFFLRLRHVPEGPPDEALRGERNVALLGGGLAAAAAHAPDHGVDLGLRGGKRAHGLRHVTFFDRALGGPHGARSGFDHEPGRGGVVEGDRLRHRIALGGRRGRVGGGPPDARKDLARDGAEFGVASLGERAPVGDLLQHGADLCVGVGERLDARGGRGRRRVAGGRRGALFGFLEVGELGEQARGGFFGGLHSGPSFDRVGPPRSNTSPLTRRQASKRRAWRAPTSPPEVPPGDSEEGAPRFEA